MTEKFHDYDATEFLETEDDIAYYLEAVMDEDPALLPAALREVARARGGMTELARKTGLSRESLYRSLTEDSDPRFSTVCKITAAFGVPLGPKHAAATA
ncbi:MAG: putative addiction module antidote protein [Actinomycetia bacterium]|nr:putative addiction module antidote protein [Actinomycetes bacterium]